MTIVIGESAMQYSKVEICGVDTSKLRVLKEKEKLELLKKIREGDKSAREKLINGNLRLVLSVIQRFTNRGENLDDLFQVGVIGLIKAIDNLGRDPTVDEIAKELGTSRSDVVLALEAIVEPVSLFEPVYSDGGDTIYVMDQVGGSETDTDWLDEISIKESIKELSPREKKILALRFMQGKTQMEVASEIGISQAQVSRLEKGAIRKIKE